MSDNDFDVYVPANSPVIEVGEIQDRQTAIKNLTEKGKGPSSVKPLRPRRADALSDRRANEDGCI